MASIKPPPFFQKENSQTKNWIATIALLLTAFGGGHGLNSLFGTNEAKIQNIVSSTISSEMRPYVALVNDLKIDLAVQRSKFENAERERQNLEKARLELIRSYLKSNEVDKALDIASGGGG